MTDATSTTSDAVSNANFKSQGDAQSQEDLNLRNLQRQMFEHQVVQQKRQNQNQNKDILQFLEVMQQASQRRKEQEKKEEEPTTTQEEEVESPKDVSAEERLTKVKRKIQYD